jgi:hypothetical protein
MEGMNMHQKTDGLELVWIRREAERVLHLLEGLKSHTAFLDEVRERKAKGGASLGLEREVILHAQEAEQDARELAVITLRLAAHFDTAGVLEEAAGEWTRRLNEKHPVEAREFWAKMADDLQLPKRLHEAGISQSLIDWLQGQLGKATFAFDVNDRGEPIVRSDDNRIEVTITDATRQGKPSSLRDVLFARRLDATIAALLESGRVVAPVSLAPVAEDGKYRITIMDGALAGAVFHLQEFTRRRRQLEDVGLPGIEGRFIDPLTAYVLGFTAAAVGAVLIVLCNETNDEELCAAGIILAAIGFHLVAAGAAESVAATAAGLKAPAMDWWELRVGDIPAYQNVVQGAL